MKPGKQDSEETKQIKDMLALKTKANATLYNKFLKKIRDGDKLTLAEKRLMDSVAVELAAEIQEPKEPVKQEDDCLDPLAYMLKVMNDQSAEKERRDRMAIAAAPFMHPRKGEGSKKEDMEDRAKRAGAGRFSPSAPPIKLVK